MPNPILDAARARLLAITAERAALDREERELRAMVAAAEGASSAPALTPTRALPVIVPHYGPPGYPWTIGDGLAPFTLGPRYQCIGGPSCGCGCNGFVWCSTHVTTTDRAVLTTGERAGDVVTLSGSCGAVSTFTGSILVSSN